MSNRNKQILTIVLCVVMLGNTACGTAVHQPINGEEGAMYGMAPGETVWLRQTRNSEQKRVRIKAVDGSGIQWSDEHGLDFAADWIDLYAVGPKQTAAVDPDQPRSKASEAAEDVATVVGYTVLGAFLAVACVGALATGNAGCFNTGKND